MSYIVDRDVTMKDRDGGIDIIYQFGYNAYFEGKKRIEVKAYNEALVAFILFSFTKNNVETKNSKILLALTCISYVIFFFPQKYFKIKHAFKGHK